MEKFNVVVYVLVSFLLSSPLFHLGGAGAKTAGDGSEAWGYVQGGPGASGVGIGNFQEIGPLDVNLEPRNSTWLKKADLLFVVVGTGYSFVEDTKLLVKTDVEAATDLTTLLIKVFNKDVNLQKSPLYIVAESYGGKFAVTAGLSVLKAIEAGKLKLKLGGVALGDSWISPEDFVLSWGPLLKDVSRIDENGLEISNSCLTKHVSENSIANQIKKKLVGGQFEEATTLWSKLEDVISAYSNSVDFYNFMLDSDQELLSTTSQSLAMKRYKSYLGSLKASPGSEGDLDSLMNGAIKKKLKIIPPHFEWGEQSGSVFDTMAGDFMRPRINEVDELLSKGVNVTIYNGQVDLICATKGTEAWVQKLKWEGLKTFKSIDRTPMYCGNDQTTRGFTKSYKNLHFYWILGADTTEDAGFYTIKMYYGGEFVLQPAFDYQKGRIEYFDYFNGEESSMLELRKLVKELKVNDKKVNFWFKYGTSDHGAEPFFQPRQNVTHLDLSLPAKDVAVSANVARDFKVERTNGNVELELRVYSKVRDKDVKLTTYSFLSLTVGGSTKSLFFKENLSSCPPISESMNSISSSVAGSDDSPAFQNLVLLCFAGGGGQSSIAGILFFSDSGVRSSNSSLLSSLVVSSPSISIPLASLSTSISSTVSFGRSWSITTFSSDMVWTLESTEMGKGLRGEIELLD
nr:serine carboxypeptidase-like 51 [Ipomoea batatas]